MSHLTFADLINRGIPLAASEAAALTLAVARVLDSQRSNGGHVRLPDDEWILLSSAGEVSMVEVLANGPEDETARLSALLRRLLHLDEGQQMPERGLVPGGLMIVLARNLGHIHLPGTGPVAFRDALERFAVHDPAALAAVFWRAASARAETPAKAAAVRPAARRPARDERRRCGLSPSESRRVIRDLERELFELRSQVPGDAAVLPAASGSRRSAMAAGLAASFTGILAVAALSLTGSAPGVQTSSAAAAPTPPRPAVTASPAVAVAAIPAVDTPPQAVADTPETAAAAAAPAPAAARGGDSTPLARAAGGSGARRPQTGPRAADAAAPAKRRAAPRNPLAMQRGGTRGIPFAVPRG